jgi:hypothetical protein
MRAGVPSDGGVYLDECDLLSLSWLVCLLQVPSNPALCADNQSSNPRRDFASLWILSIYEAIQKNPEAEIIHTPILREGTMQRQQGEERLTRLPGHGYNGRGESLNPLSTT